MSRAFCEPVRLANCRTKSRVGVRVGRLAGPHPPLPGSSRQSLFAYQRLEVGSLRPTCAIAGGLRGDHGTSALYVSVRVRKRELGLDMSSDRIEPARFYTHPRVRADEAEAPRPLPGVNALSRLRDRHGHGRAGCGGLRRLLVSRFNVIEEGEADPNSWRTPRDSMTMGASLPSA